jgi:hypothetical protein
MRMTATPPGHVFRAGPRRALPRSCRPAQDETTGSYLLRLAAVNRIPGADLISYLTASTSLSTAQVSLTALAVASGHPPLTLAYALPELRAQHPDYQAMTLHGRTLPSAPNIVRPACRRCAAARHGTGRIDIWYRHEQNICLTHQLWTGPGANQPHDQPDLAAAPDITRAQAHHLHLIRRHGRHIVHTAYDTARIAWRNAARGRRGMPDILLRDLPLPAGFGHQDWPARPADPVHAAVSYPETVTLTGLLLTLRWQSALVSAARYSQFLAETRRQLTLAFPVLDHAARNRLINPILTAITIPAAEPMPETGDSGHRRFPTAINAISSRPDNGQPLQLSEPESAL